MHQGHQDQGADQAHIDQGDYHWRESSAGTSGGIGKDLQKDIDKIKWEADACHTAAQSNDLRIPGKKAIEGFGKKNNQGTHNQGDDDAKFQRGLDTIPASLHIAGTDVLADKGRDSLAKSQDRVIDQGLHSEVGGESRDTDDTQGVDLGLDDHVGEGNDHSLNAGGQTDSENLTCQISADADLAEIQAISRIQVEKMSDGHKAGTGLGKEGGKCYTGHTHAKDVKKEKVTDDIGNAAYQLIDHRRSGITQSS